MTAGTDFGTDTSNVAQVGDVGTIQLHLDHGSKPGLFTSSGSISDFNDQVSEPSVLNHKFSSTYKINKIPVQHPCPGGLSHRISQTSSVISTHSHCVLVGPELQFLLCGSHSTITTPMPA